jgi:hypothetical protein
VQVGERSVFEATYQHSVRCCHVVSSLWISFLWTLWPALQIRVSVVESRLGRRALILLPHTLRRFSFFFFPFPLLLLNVGRDMCSRFGCSTWCCQFPPAHCSFKTWMEEVGRLCCRSDE